MLATMKEEEMGSTLKDGLRLSKKEKGKKLKKALKLLRIKF